MTTFDLLPCQRDCYAREGQAAVLSCDPAPSKGASNGRFKLTLSASPLYPEGGGQPGDRGRLFAPGGKVLANVIDVQRDSNGAAAVYTDAPVPSQADVLVKVDWAHRFDLMQQHTGQHLLSAVCDEVAGADTVSWELHPAPTDGESSDSVCIDLAIPHLSSEQLQAIEERCNAVIRSGAAVRQVIVSESNRQAVATSKLLRGNLPHPDRVNGPVRMIEIEGVDINACGGTHLHSASEIQAIKIKNLERTKGMVRLRFIAGGRVFAAMGRYLAQEAALNKVLGCGLPGWSRAVQKIQSDRKQLSQRVTAYSTEVAQTYAQSILPQLLISNGWLHSHRDDADAEFLSIVAAAVEEASPGAMTFLTGGNVTPGRQHPHRPAEKVFLLSGPKDKVAKLGPKVAEALGTKGGGRPGAFQGKASSLDGLPEVLKIIHQSSQSPSRASIGCAPTGCFVGRPPMLTPSGGGLVGTQPMLVPILAPALQPTITPTVPTGSAAEAQLLANVELAEQRLREFNIMYNEQRQKLLNDEEGAVDTYRRVVGDLPIRPVLPLVGGL